jgi:hypothetical protein
MSKSLLSFAACLSLVTVPSLYAQRVEVRASDQPERRVEVRAEEPRATRQVEVRSAEVQPAGHAYRAKEVLGSKVSIEGNVSIGRVDDIVFDGDGYVEYLIVDNEGKLVTVPWEAAKFNFKERSAMVNITPDQFKQVPTYTVEKYPVFTAPTYRTDTYRYYGLTPRERRIERRIDRRN